MEPLWVRDGVILPPGDLSWTASRASGPGGQNVNKVSSKVELRFDLSACSVLSSAVKTRLAALAGHTLDSSGCVRIVSQLTRDQSRNLEDARTKLAELVCAALVVPKKRRATKRTYGSQQRRLDSKSKDSAKKAQRRGGHDD